MSVHKDDFSFLKIIFSAFLHLVASITIGPLITIILFILWLIAIGQGGTFANYLTEESLVGYWFIIISFLIFGLVWLNFFNNRKDISLRSIKCYKWWSEYWNYMNQEQNFNLDLPTEAEDHFDIRIINMDKKLARLLGVLVLSVMSTILSIIIFSTKDKIRNNLPTELVFSENQWLIGFSFFIILAILTAFLVFYFFYRFYFVINKNHVYWRKFWLGILLYTLQKSYTEYSNKNKSNPIIISYVTYFKTQYESIAKVIDAHLSDSSLSMGQKVWLEQKLEELEKSPSILIPKSLTTIGTFYGFAILIAGSFGNAIAGPASEFLRFISGFFI